MATIKSFTDLQQSKKLAEILPPESADMGYNNGELRIGYTPLATKRDDYFPCWSLAALLSVLPKKFSYDNHTYQFMYNTNAMFYINLDTYDEDTFCSTNENLIDACYELILKLNELNLL